MKKVLIVEDEDAILEAMTIILTDVGFEVEGINDGETALAKVKSFKPDLVLVDMLMSGMDGRDICALIKRDENLKSIKVVMVSAHPEAQKSYLKYRADDYMPKPFEASELIKMVKKYTK